MERYTDSIPGTLVTFEMVPVPGGISSLSDTAGAGQVIVKPLWFGRTEVTWELYDAFALSPMTDAERPPGADAVARPTRPYGAPDYGWGHAGYPVISVASTAARAFCEWLSARTGRTYRLPTDAEWEHAARLALADVSRLALLDSLAWHAGNAGGQTRPVGKRRADALGLFDLFGNAAEWVTTATSRPVLRGGSYRDALKTIGPAARAEQTDAWNERDPQLPQSRWWLSDGPFAGFRIVREP